MCIFINIVYVLLKIKYIAFPEWKKSKHYILIFETIIKNTHIINPNVHVSIKLQ